MSNQPQPNHDLMAMEVPAPNEMFIVKTIHADNLAATRRAILNKERQLKPKSLKLLTKLLKQLNDQLTAAGYWEKKQEYQQLYQRIVELRVERRQLVETAKIHWRDWNAQQRYEAHAHIEQLKQQIISFAVAAKRLKDEATELHPVARKHRAITERLEEHKRALQSKAHHTKLRIELADESYAFVGLIQERLAQLGFKEERLVGKKHIIKKVKFYTPHITPDRIFLKVLASRKGIVGFTPVLPQGVRVADIISPETCRELEISIQRQVQGKYTVTNGAFLIINRIGSRDGIMDYVTLSQVLQRYDHYEHHLLPVLFGVGEGRAIWRIKLAEHPHMLIGGSTGSGKSNAENVILATLTHKQTPAEVRFVLIDLKEGLEFRRYESIPHLLCPVITEVDDAARVLASIEALRADRAKDFQRYWARDIDEFNNRVNPEKRVPRIIVLFDEYAAINTKPDTAKTIQQLVMQLLNKGRATGIHLIICTQNPSVDILPGFSKNNITFRLAGIMPTTAASHTILGTGDAADLPADIKGRMIAMVGAGRFQIQTAHATNEDIAYALEVASEHPKAPEIMLPEPDNFTVVLDENRLLEIALREFAGALKARPIYDYVKDEGIATRTIVEVMVKELAAKKEINFAGKVYAPKLQKGNFYRLVELVS